MQQQQLYFLSALLFLASNVKCEKKISLEDIEKDQRHSSESNRAPTKKASLETLQAEETKYPTTKAEILSTISQQQQQQQSSQTSLPTSSSTTALYGQQQHLQQQYHVPTTTSSQELGNQVGDYAELPAYETFKYAVITKQIRVFFFTFFFKATKCSTYNPIVVCVKRI